MQHFNRRLLISAAVLAVAIVFGGGGSPAPGAELIVELFAIAAMIAWVWLVRRDRAYPGTPMDWPLLILVICFAAIPVLQLVPLPPSFWHSLPGRDIEVQALALVDRASAWMPISMSPTRTLASLLSLIPPLVMFFMVSRLKMRDRSKLLGVLAGLAGISVIVGAVQLASGDANWLRFYTDTHYGFATGFQANRNAQADILLIAMIALAAWAFPRRRFQESRQAQSLIVVGLILFVLSVITTGSRAGLALVLVAILACVVVAVPLLRLLTWKGLAAVGIVVAIAGVGYVARDNPRIQRTLTRFGNEDDIRPEIWQDTWYAIGQHWPAGSGIGTFRPVFTAAERLEVVRPTYANRAHDDYLEFALESGIVAPALLIIAFVFATLRLGLMWRRPRSPDERAQAICVAAVLLVLALHSLVDYPMRSLSLATIAGMMAALLWRGTIAAPRQSRGSGTGV